MAYVSHEKKAKIKAALVALKNDGVIPADWRWTLAVDNGRGIVFNLWEAGEDLIAYSDEPNRRYLSPYWKQVDGYLPNAPERIKDAFRAVGEALNIDNYDRSDIMSDYFDVGHYVYIRLGTWEKPFKVNGVPKEIANV